MHFKVELIFKQYSNVPAGSAAAQMLFISLHKRRTLTQTQRQFTDKICMYCCWLGINHQGNKTLWGARDAPTVLNTQRRLTKG